MKKKHKHVQRERRRQLQKGGFLGFLCVCILLSYLCGPMILAASLGDYHNEEALYAKGISTTGTVTAIDSMSKTTLAVGNFATITGQTVSFQFDIDHPDDAYVGEPVAILYNPASPYPPDGMFIGTRDEVWGTSRTEFFVGLGLLLFAIIGTSVIVVIIRRESRSNFYKNRFKRLKKTRADKVPTKPLL